MWTIEELSMLKALSRNPILFTKYVKMEIELFFWKKFRCPIYAEFPGAYFVGSLSVYK